MIKLLSIICQKEKLIRAHCKYANIKLVLCEFPYYYDSQQRLPPKYICGAYKTILSSPYYLCYSCSRHQSKPFMLRYTLYSAGAAWQPIQVINSLGSSKISFLSKMSSLFNPKEPRLLGVFFFGEMKFVFSEFSFK